MREYLEEDFVEEVTNRTGYPGRIWYLPHHAVIREDKTTTRLDLNSNNNSTCSELTRFEPEDPNLLPEPVLVLL
ncbi:hypothetical protein T08_6406 [Trichinella sp. T8]|nr:hypothetical protein T08_6406 [Trichinella sp. T8]